VRGASCGASLLTPSPTLLPANAAFLQCYIRASIRLCYRFRAFVPAIIRLCLMQAPHAAYSVLVNPLLVPSLLAAVRIFFASSACLRGASSMERRQPSEDGEANGMRHVRDIEEQAWARWRARAGVGRHARTAALSEGGRLNGGRWRAACYAAWAARGGAQAGERRASRRCRRQA